MKEKLYYESPETAMFNISVEGTLCLSGDVDPQYDGFNNEQDWCNN